MARKNRTKKLEQPVTLFCAIEAKQHEALKFIAYKEHRSLTDIAREAIDDYILKKSQNYPIHITY